VRNRNLLLRSNPPRPVCSCPRQILEGRALQLTIRLARAQPCFVEQNLMQIDPEIAVKIEEGHCVHYRRIFLCRDL
jgi:hypothetical protein